MSKKYVSVLKDSAATPGYRIIAPEDYVYTENGTKKVKKIDSKADKKVPATAGNLATLDSTGNLADSGKQTTDFMNALTTAYEASGSATKTVTKVTQAKTGAVTVTYSDIQSGTTAQKGLVQLEDSTSSTSTTKAATPNSVKSAYDLANGKYSKPSGGIPSSDMDSAVQASLGKADTAIQGVKLNGSTLTPSSAKVVDLGNLKTKQTAVSDPSASGTTITAIATISQDANGVITATKKTIQSASQSQDGVMSAADKKKLDGIATGAEVNQNAFSNVKVGDVTVAADAKTDTLTLAAGSNVTITPDATSDKITIAAKDTTYTADAGIRLDGTVFKHTNSVSGGTVGPTTDTAGATLSVPYVTYDSQGHVTASGTRTHNVGTASTSGAGIVQLQDSIDATTTKAATPNAVKKAIEALDVSSVGGSGKYISAISETDGKISATSTTMDTTPTASSEKAVTSGGVKSALDGKVDVANVNLNGQTTTILAQVQSLAASNIHYKRFYTSSDSGTANIPDKPTGTTNAGFMFEAYCNRYNSSSDWRYVVLCYVTTGRPKITWVTQSTTSISWKDLNKNTDTLVKATAKTDNVNYKVLATASASPTSGNATEAVYDTDISLNPSTNTITANISGNAATATKPMSTLLNNTHDLDTIKGSSQGDVLTYRWASGNVPANAPLSNATSMMQVYRVHGGNYVKQVVAVAGGEVYARSMYENSWDPWTIIYRRNGVPYLYYTMMCLRGTTSTNKYKLLGTLKSYKNTQDHIIAMFRVDFVKNVDKQDYADLMVTSVCTNADTPTYNYYAEMLRYGNEVTHLELKLYANASGDIELYAYAPGATDYDWGHLGISCLYITRLYSIETIDNFLTLKIAGATINGSAPSGTEITISTSYNIDSSDVTSTYSATGTSPVNGTAVASALGSYLPLSGGTMTGKITAWGSKYTDDGTTGAIDMQNSNIVGLNSIYTKDASENASEGIHFVRDATHTDTLWMAGGHMYFVPNRTLAGSSASTSAADSKKVAILPASITANQMVVTDGTSGDVKGVDAYNGRGVIAAVGLADGRRNRGNATGDGWGKIASITKSSGIASTNISSVWSIVCNTSSTNSVYILRINIRGTSGSLPSTQLCKLYGNDDFDTTLFGIKLVIRGTSASSVTAEIWACTSKNYTSIAISELAGGEMEMGNTRKWTYYTVSGGGEAAPVADATNNVQVVDPVIDTYSWNHFYNGIKEVAFDSSVTLATFLSNAQTTNSFANKVFGAGLTDTALLTINAIGRLNISNNTNIQAELENLGGYPMFHVVATRQAGYVEFEGNGKKVRYHFGTSGALTSKYYEFVKLNNSVSATPSFYAPTTGGTTDYVLIGNGATSAPTWAEKAPKAVVADYPAGFASRLTTWGWGTLTTANGYTQITEWHTSNNSDIAFAEKSGSISVQIDGKFYQNEGANKVLDAADVSVPSTVPTLAWNTESTLATIDGKNIKVKLPASPDTDTKVTQTADDATDSSFEVLLSNTADNTTRTETARKSSRLKLNTKTGTLSVGGPISRALASSGTIAETDVLAVSGSTDGFKITYEATASDAGVARIGMTDDSNAKLLIGNWGGTNNTTFYPAISIVNGTATPPITINNGSATVIGSLTGNATTATTASKLGTSNVGSDISPIYLSSGTPTEIYYRTWKNRREDSVNALGPMWYVTGGTFKVATDGNVRYVALAMPPTVSSVEMALMGWKSNSPFLLHIQLFNFTYSGTAEIIIKECNGYPTAHISKIITRWSTSSNTYTVYFEMDATATDFSWRSTSADITSELFSILTKAEYDAITTNIYASVDVNRGRSISTSKRNLQRGKYDVLDVGDVVSSYDATGTAPVNGTAVASAISGKVSKSGDTMTGGLEIQGVKSGTSYAQSGGGYNANYNNIILRGDPTYGTSGILFTSSKGTTSINQISDRGFIQFHSRGVTPVAESSTPTMDTSGEANSLVIGVGNDSYDQVWIQTPSTTGLKHLIGATKYTIYDEANLPAATSASAVATTSSAGSASTFSRGDHAHSISLATGDSDGQVKIAGSNVSVKGWGNDSDGNKINTTYLKLSGGTMTGKITAQAGQYTDDNVSCAINMNNSNIIGLNSIYTADASDGASEGIHFYRDATHVDTLWMAGGALYFVPNRALGTSTSAADSQKVARLPASITDNQVVLTNGTAGALKTSTLDAACNLFINALSTGTSIPTDNDYYVSQYVGGGTTTTSYHRRPVSALWTYIKGKLTSVSGVNISGNAATATSATNSTNSAVTADTTHQLYLIGATGSSGQQALKTDTGIYATATAGQLHATTFDVNSKCTLQFNTTTNALDFVFA